jgi:signal transduction histidine kinase
MDAHDLVRRVGVIGILVVVGGYVVARATFRELEVARLQREFVAAVSHEFRPPLTSMKHLVEMLDQDAVPSEERRRLYYRVLAQETNRLQRLVEDLLDFQRMEAGRAVYAMAPLDVAELVESVAAAFAGQHGSADRVVVRIAQRGVLVRADAEALSRALWNLLDNAAKYAPADTPIAVELSADGGAQGGVAEDGAVRQGVARGVVRISVRDRGPGIAASDQARVFDKFYRAPSAIAAGVKGTGIGLAIVQHIVSAHGGRVVLESRPGDGCSFTIEVPVDEQGLGTRR